MGLTPKHLALLFVVLGAALIVAGAGLIYPPAGLMVAGAGSIGLGLIGVDIDKRARK